MPGSNPFGDPQTAALLGLAQGLLQAGAPSPFPTNFSGALAQGAGGALSGAMNAQKMTQQQALVDLERLRAQQAQRTLDMQSWALGFPQSGNTPGTPPATSPTEPAPTLASPQAQPQAASFGAQPAPQLGATPQPTVGPLAGLPEDAQRAIRLNIGLPGSGNIAWQATQPIVGREGGIYRRTPNGGMELDPGWIEGERKRIELQKGAEDAHTIVDVPMADGRTQKMTKAQALNLTSATNQIVNSLPGLNAEAISSIQRQLAAEPDKPVNVDINLGGRQAKLTLQPLGGPGFTSGQSTEARSAAEKSGANAGDVQNQIDTEAHGALQSRRILTEMRGLSQEFTQGKVAPFQRALGEWAQALKLPGNWEQEIKVAESQQALQKLTAQMATAAMKQFTNRGTQMEFKTFLQNNPNAELTPGGFQKVLEFMDKSAQASLDKQQAYIEWRKTNPVERSQDFEAEWNKKQTAELTQATAKTAPPKKGEVIDGWEFVGGDPGQRMNWRKK